jgi:hypothetical protein
MQQARDRSQLLRNSDHKAHLQQQQRSPPRNLQLFRWRKVGLSTLCGVSLVICCLPSYNGLMSHVLCLLWSLYSQAAGSQKTPSRFAQIPRNTISTETTVLVLPFLRWPVCQSVICY